MANAPLTEHLEEIVAETEARLSEQSKQAAVLANLRLVRGPLSARKNYTILAQYNELSLSRIAIGEFLHWIQNSPAGPAWHALVETDDGEIVGHTCLIPFHGRCDGKRIVAAKSEYGFIREEYRSARIRGFEHLTRPRQMIMIDQLFRHCLKQGWGPLVISTSPALQRFGGRIGCCPTDFPLWECLLVSRPWGAIRSTPNLNWRQKTLLGTAGVLQQAMWFTMNTFASEAAGIRLVPMADELPPQMDQRLAFFGDRESLQWRYLADQYSRLAPDPTGSDYVIVKTVPHDFVRVCQWQLSPEQPTFSLIDGLMRLARQKGALGVRWAIYGRDAEATKLVGRLRRFGFVCARRVRTLLIRTEEQQFLAPEEWNLTDAMFSFHHYQQS